MGSMLRVLYTIAITLLLPLILLRVAFRNLTDTAGHRKAGSRRRLFERFGSLPEKPRTGGVIFHAVSVGESIAAIELIKKFIDRHPDIPVTVTCTTPSASRIIRSKFDNSVQHYYLPYDHPLFIAPFLKAIQPKTLAIMETEMWPNLAAACKSRDINLLLLNARLSEKSYSGYLKLKPLVQNMLFNFSKVCVQTGDDRDRFIKLGLPEERSLVTGNLKNDLELDPSIDEIKSKLHQDLLSGRRCWIAASTHEGEDELIIEAHKKVLIDHPNLVLVLVPRHPPRANSVRSLLSENALRFVSRTDSRGISSDESVFLLDTIGELIPFYGVSDICFIGGSLVDIGGHNPLEPAVLSKPILSGPYTRNFHKIYEDLEAQGAVKFVNNQHELAERLLEIFEDEELAAGLGERAFRYTTLHRGASAKSLQVLEEIGSDI